MSKLPTKQPFDFTAIRGIKNIEDAKQWLGTFGRNFESWYTKLMDTIIGKILGESKRYRFIESGDDLIAQWKNDSGIWVDTGWKLKKPA